MAMVNPTRQRTVFINNEIFRALLDWGRALYPRETIILLRGKVDKNGIWVNDIVVPPKASYGFLFSAFDSYLLPIDPSIVGTAHSHPSGPPRPSTADMNRGFFGRIMVIVAYPFESERDVGVFDGGGRKMALRVLPRKV